MLNLLKSTMKNGIQVSKLDCEKLISIGSSKFGGQPHVPTNFEWPYFDGENYYVERKNRPLSFLAQFNLAEISPLDTDNLLPKQGMLYFFYELETMCWGYDKKEKDSFRVFYYDVDPSELVCATIPEDLKQEYIVPEMPTQFNQVRTYASFEYFRDNQILDFMVGTTAEDFNDVANQLQETIMDEYETFHQLLGHSQEKQNCLEIDMELAHSFSPGHRFSPEDEIVLRDKSEESEWQLLFQMGTIAHNDFFMMFGDCGQIYFYIKKKDLLNRDFSKAWMILQCS